ncbi:MAG: hypothetical protein Sapg2KO_08300 [Saprospiraceae bacterium]
MLVADTQYGVLPDTTRVWIYQSNRPFTAEESKEITLMAQQFAQRWVSHSQQLKAYATLLHDRFLILMVDESNAGASGCSIDSSVAFVKALQAQYEVNFFDRMRFSFKDGDEVKTLSRADFSQWYQNGKINDQTMVFDTLVKNKAELDQNFVRPLKESWHARMV